MKSTKSTHQAQVTEGQGWERDDCSLNISIQRQVLQTAKLTRVRSSHDQGGKRFHQAFDTYMAASEDRRNMPPTATAPGVCPRFRALRAWGFRRELNHLRASRGITPV